MSRDWRLLLLWIAILVAVAGGSAVAYANMPSVKCDRIGGEWIAASSHCLCNGDYLTL